MLDWSELPHDLLVEIAGSIKRLEDFIAFGAVCKRWCKAGEKEHEIVASISIPKFKRRKCHESLGWLLAVEEDGSMCLLDPFSSVKIPLPHQQTFPGYEFSFMDEYVFVHKMVLSARPSEISDFVVMIICGGFGHLAFWRPGDERWGYTTSKFQVYEVDVSADTWVEINNIGNMAIFVSHNATFAVDCSGFYEKIKGNHIYFSDDGWESYHFYEEKGGGKDMGIYNLQTGTIESFYSGEVLLSKVCPSIWITAPTF